MTEELKAKVVLVGPPGVGKTSLVRRYVLNEFNDRYLMTLGAIVYKRTEDVAFESRTVRVTMTVWDTMGEPQFIRLLSDVYLRGAGAVLAVADVTEQGTVPPMDRWVDTAVQIAGDIPVQILLNKRDLGVRVEAQFAGLTAGLGRAAPCYLTSAKSGDNVEAAFRDLARRLVERQLIPLEGPLDETDEALVVDLSSATRTVEELASLRGLAHIVAEARLERLRRKGFVRISTLGLDGRGRPRISYSRTERPLAELFLVE